jgi:hypothetical protein
MPTAKSPSYFVLPRLPLRAACASALAATSFSFFEVWVFSSLPAALATFLLVVITGVYACQGQSCMRSPRAIACLPRLSRLVATTYTAYGLGSQRGWGSCDDTNSSTSPAYSYGSRKLPRRLGCPVSPVSPSSRRPISSCDPCNTTRSSTRVIRP